MTDHYLNELLEPWVAHVPKILFRGITLDSRKAAAGDLFLAVSGHKTDGRLYISQASQQGIVAIIAQAESPSEEGKIDQIHDVPIIYLFQLPALLSSIGDRFYKQPSHSMNVIGVTGTNGKTTIAYLLAQWIYLLGKISAFMGTIGNGVLGDIHPSYNTTCSAIEVQKLLSKFYQQGANFVAMEISSHGLVQNRVSNLHFAAVFTNLSRDHLDYHGNMKKYELAKWNLFNELDVSYKIINADDVVGQDWLKKLPQAIPVAMKKNIQSTRHSSWLYAGKVRYHKHGAEIPFFSSWGNGILQSPLNGIFNVSNLLLALTTLLSLGYQLPDLLNSVRQLKSVCGRMEVFHTLNSPTVLLDYAHTPDALKQALVSARMHCYGKLWCIFGSGGERDKGKRPLMGAIAEKYADRIIITDDNPREEDPQDIINDIKSGLVHLRRADIISNREAAITHAILKAKPEDILLVAGKGHEDYQIIGKKRLNYSDRDTVTRLLSVMA